jgi:hypothetical protein
MGGVDDDAITINFRGWVHVVRPQYYGVFKLGPRLMKVRRELWRCLRARLDAA